MAPLLEWAAPHVSYLPISPVYLSRVGGPFLLGRQSASVNSNETRAVNCHPGTQNFQHCYSFRNCNSASSVTHTSLPTNGETHPSFRLPSTACLFLRAVYQISPQWYGQEDTKTGLAASETDPRAVTAATEDPGTTRPIILRMAHATADTVTDLVLLTATTATAPALLPLASATTGITRVLLRRGTSVAPLARDFTPTVRAIRPRQGTTGEVRVTAHVLMGFLPGS